MSYCRCRGENAYDSPSVWMAYLMDAAIQNTPNVVEHSDGGLRRDVIKEPQYESYSVFLLLAWSINICKKKGDVMSTHERHPAHIVVSEATARPWLFFITVGSFVRFLALIYCRVRNPCPPRL